MDRKRLSVWTKLKYGVGDFGMSLVSSMLSFSMLFYYTDVVGVNPGLAGTAILLVSFVGIWLMTYYLDI